MPLKPHSFAACAIFSACACSSNALVGMQPQIKQVPPSAFCFSTTATLRPSCAARIAATYPPVPAPITTTSNSLAKPLLTDQTTNFGLRTSNFELRAQHPNPSLSLGTAECVKRDEGLLNGRCGGGLLFRCGCYGPHPCLELSVVVFELPVLLTQLGHPTRQTASGRQGGQRKDPARDRHDP